MAGWYKIFPSGIRLDSGAICTQQQQQQQGENSRGLEF